MKVALVHDWLLGMRGGERVLEVISELFPEAEIYTLFYDRSRVSSRINAHKINPSFLNSLPGLARYYRLLLPVFPLAMRLLSRKINQENCDLVISVSHCAAKNLRLREETFHLCYCLSPMRYIWDKYQDYFANSRVEFLIRQIAKYLRSWDKAYAARVDSFACISKFIRARIASVYGKSSKVIYPPVDTSWIEELPLSASPDKFLCANALVPYKNTKLVIEAFNELALPLVVLGKGPELPALKAMARENITFVEYLSDENLAKLYRHSRALVFAAEEDSGMIPVEMQAAGRPVIAYARGGSLETLSDKTGVFFKEASSQSIVLAVKEFLAREKEFSPRECREQAKKFSKQIFLEHFSALLAESGFEIGEFGDVKIRANV